MPTLWIRWRIEDTRPSGTDPIDAPNAARGSIEGHTREKFKELGASV